MDVIKQFKLSVASVHHVAMVGGQIFTQHGKRAGFPKSALVLHLHDLAVALSLSPSLSPLLKDNLIVTLSRPSFIGEP